MNKVSSYERRIARVRAYTLNKFERSGVHVISRAALTAMRRYKQAYLSGRLANGLIAQYMLAAENELTDLWVVAYLTGLRHSAASVDIQFSTAHSKQVDFLRKFLNMTSDEVEKLRGVRKAAMHEEILKISQTAEQRIQKALLKSIADGEHIADSVARLEDAFRKSGLTPKNSFQLEGIVRTNMQIAYSGARWQTDQIPEIANLLWGYKYVTVGDDRVRPNHAAMDGVTLPKDHSFWQTHFPPNGWACRCQAIEIFGERDEVLPPEGEVEIDGELTSAEPDQGFAFNPGTMVPMPKRKDVQLAQDDDTADDGFWFTTKTGAHIYVEPGEGVADAIKRTFENKEKTATKSKSKTVPISKTVTEYKDHHVKYDFANHEQRTSIKTTMEALHRSVSSVADVNVEVIGQGDFSKKFPQITTAVSGKYDWATDTTYILPDAHQSNTADLVIGKNNFNVDQSLAGTLRHELGHRLCNRGVPKSKIKDLINEFNLNRTGEAISKYSKTNSREYFAEAYSAYTHPSYVKGMMSTTTESLIELAIKNEKLGKINKPRL